MDVDFEALRDALADKATDAFACDVCDGRTWGFGKATVAPIPLDLPESDAETETEPWPGYWTIICIRCGSVRFFDVETLLGLRTWEIERDT